MSQQSPPALLKPAEAAAALRVSTRTLRDWANHGRIEFVQLPGGHVRYRREVIESIAAGVEAAS